jgi:hypothetical protein
MTPESASGLVDAGYEEVDWYTKLKVQVDHYFLDRKDVVEEGLQTMSLCTELRMYCHVN